MKKFIRTGWSDLGQTTSVHGLAGEGGAPVCVS